MSLEFLSPIAGGEAAASTPIAASPFEPWLHEAGARFEERDGWRIATSFGSAERELAACREGLGISDRSPLGKLELQGRPRWLAGALQQVLEGSPPGAGETAALDGGLLWLSSPDRAVAVCEPGGTARLRALLARAGTAGCTLVEVTAGYAVLELRGPRARELVERLTAIDVREGSLPVGGVRQGAIARVGAALLRAEPEAFLVLLPAPQAADALELVLEAGRPLGLCPVGEEVRAQVEQPVWGARARA